MTVEQYDVVDFCSVDKRGDFVLTIADHLGWEDANSHLYCLQEKLNAYLRFIESGEIFQKFPQANGRPIKIFVALKFPCPGNAKWFFEKAFIAISEAGFGFESAQFSG